MGDHELGTGNERGDRLVQMYQEEDFSIMNSFFRIIFLRLPWMFSI